MKKNIILSAVALVAFVSCTSIENASPADQEIVFQKVNYSAQTKAGESALSTSVPFGTYAWAQDEIPDQKFMEDTKIAFDQTESVWKAESGKYYWPKKATVDFISYAPYGVTPAPSISTSAIKVTDYVVSDGDTRDLMFADKVVGMSANYNTMYGKDGVPTLFRHALAKININIAQSKTTDGAANPTTWTVTLKKVELLTISNKGTLEMGLKSDKAISKTEFSTYAWDLPSSTDKVGWVAASQTISPVVSSTSTVLTTTAQSILANYYVLPQNLVADTQQVRLTCDIKTVNAGGLTTEEKDVVFTGDLKTDKISLWGMNQNITYTITISPCDNEILFDPAVAPWEDVDGGTIGFEF